MPTFRRQIGQLSRFTDVLNAIQDLTFTTLH